MSYISLPTWILPEPRHHLLPKMKHGPSFSQGSDVACVPMHQWEELSVPRSQREGEVRGAGHGAVESGPGSYIARGSMPASRAPGSILQTHRPSRTILIKANPTNQTWEGKGTQPVSGGSPTPHHSKPPGSCFLPSPYIRQQQPLHKPKAPSRRSYLARKPSYESSIWAEEAGPSRKDYHIQRPLDASKQTRRAHAHSQSYGSGTAPPHRALHAGGRLPAPFHHVCGPWQGKETCRHHQPQSSLNSQPCAEGQLNSSLAVISRHLTPLNRSPAAEGPLPGRRGPVGSQFLWLVLSAPSSPCSPWLCWGLTRGSTCEHQPDPQPTRASQGLPLISARCGSDLHWPGWK